MAFDLSEYREVSERIQDFRAKHPEGTLQSEIHTLTDTLVIVKAYAYRHPDDPRPGVGLASEPIPGKTPYTRDSEVMNAETSAWGRAIIAVGASDAKKVASRDEVRNRRTDQEAPPPSDESTPAGWLAARAATLTAWDEHTRRGAATEAMRMLAIENPMTQAEAESVFDHMSNAYQRSQTTEAEQPELGSPE